MWMKSEVYGIDTNVLVRYIVQDHSSQSKKASRFLETNCTVDSPGHVALITLCEVVWVLHRAYKYPKAMIVDVLDKILSTAEFNVESPIVAREAFRMYKNGSADFSDYVIGKINKDAGAFKTATFDKRAGKSELFHLL